MNKPRITRYRKPGLMVALTFFVGLGVLLTSIAQSGEPERQVSILQRTVLTLSWPDQWAQAPWDLGLAGKLKNWRPGVVAGENEDGLSLSRPFGHQGPVLQISTSVPARAEASLRDGGDSLVGISDDSPDAYIFLQKRW